MKVVLVKYTFKEFCVFLQGYTVKFKGSELLIENERGKCLAPVRSTNKKYDYKSLLRVEEDG